MIKNCNAQSFLFCTMSTQRAAFSELHVYAAAGYVDLVRTCLDRGDDPFSKDIDGKYPLDLAIENKNHEIVEMLRRRMWIYSDE